LIFRRQGDGVEHNGARNFLREEFQGRSANQTYHMPAISSSDYPLCLTVVLASVFVYGIPQPYEANHHII